MKKAITVFAILLAFAGVLFAAPAYKAKAEAKLCVQTGDIDCAVAKFLEAEAAALAQLAAAAADDPVDWQENADWQRNNAAYCLIKSQAAGETRDTDALKEALKLLTEREIKHPKVKATADRNINYCKTQLGLN